MTGHQIIEEIKRLPESERKQVFDFALESERNRRLSPEELGELAQKMVDTTDPSEAERLKEDIIRGFYGGKPHA